MSGGGRCCCCSGTKAAQCVTVVRMTLGPSAEVLLGRNPSDASISCLFKQSREAAFLLERSGKKEEEGAGFMLLTIGGI